jgi:hypothetical protein
MATSENEDYEYYAYSSDEDGYPLEGGDGDSNNSDMEWNASENPNAPPTTFARGMYMHIVMDLQHTISVFQTGDVSCVSRKIRIAT